MKAVQIIRFTILGACVAILGFLAYDAVHLAAREHARWKRLDDLVLGLEKAPVIVLDYSSFTCGHCGHFHQHIFPKVKTKYIDTGKVWWIFREYANNQVDIAASQMMRRYEGDRWEVIMDLFTTQEKWMLHSNPKAALKELLIKHGMSLAKIEEALQDEELIDSIVGQRYEAENTLHVDAIPTFILLSPSQQVLKKIEGAPNEEQFNQHLEEALGQVAAAQKDSQ